MMVVRKELSHILLTLTGFLGQVLGHTPIYRPIHPIYVISL